MNIYSYVITYAITRSVTLYQTCPELTNYDIYWFLVNKATTDKLAHKIMHSKVNNARMICWQSENQWTNLKEKRHWGLPQTPLQLKFYIWNRSNSAAPYAWASSLSFLSVTCEVEALFLEDLLWMSMKTRASWPIANISFKFYTQYK